MSDEAVLSERRGKVLILTLNRPKAMNALSIALRGQLADLVDAAEADPGIDILVLTGAGERAFSAGLDLKELGAQSGSVFDAPPGVEHRDPVRALKRFSGPVIGGINGAAITGGFELALACDILIGTPNTRFADTHARVGVMPGWGLSQKLSRTIGPYRAKELSLTGNFLDAETAERWGLLNRVVPADQLMPTCLQLADDMASAPADFLRNYKQLIDEGFAATMADGLKKEAHLNKTANADLSAAELEARREGVIARGRLQTKN